MKQEEQTGHTVFSLQKNALIQRVCAIYQYNCAKNGKGLQRKLISYRSIIGLGAFREITHFGDILDSYSAHSDLTIKSKFLKNIFKIPHKYTQLKRPPKTDGKLPMNQVDQGDYC